MPDFDFQWDIRWYEKTQWGAMGRATTADGTPVNVVLQQIKTLDWVWHNYHARA